MQAEDRNELVNYKIIWIIYVHNNLAEKSITIPCKLIILDNKPRREKPI